ncbi:5'-nucleotidase C-terminal domain-containing protein, partial [Klebsiella pneumoniae]|nr:5'-nucleotidase C-terminal domain-containing protein [Klebsiella pneumoniae]
MSTPLVDHPVNLKRKTDMITKTAYLLAESVCEFTHADCAIINAGLVVKGIEGPNVTEYDVHQMLPHPINLVRIKITGRDLKQVILTAEEQAYMHEHAQGLGFRGDIFGGYILYQMGYIESESRFFVQGEEIV